LQRFANPENDPLENVIPLRIHGSVFHPFSSLSRLPSLFLPLINLQKHGLDYHATEAVWNTVPRIREKSTIATRDGLVNYGLSFANRHWPAEPTIEFGGDWNTMRFLMVAKFGMALHIVMEANVYLRGRTIILNAPEFPELSDAPRSKAQRLWLKRGSRLRATADFSPSELWRNSSRERRVNAHHIFFFARDYHRACVALLKYRPNDLPGTGDTALADREPAEWI
jgi:hypothetical protein